MRKDEAVDRDLAANREGEVNVTRDGRDARDTRDTGVDRHGDPAERGSAVLPDNYPFDKPAAAQVVTFATRWVVDETGTKAGTPWVILRQVGGVTSPKKIPADPATPELSSKAYSPEGRMELDLHEDAVRHFPVGGTILVSLQRLGG